MAIELAKAYLPIIPSLGKGFKANLEKEIGGAIEQAADNAGSGFGERLFKGLKVGAAVTGAAVGGVLATSIVKGFGRLSAIENAEAKLSGLGNTAEDVTEIMDNALAAVKGTAFGLDEAATTAASAVAAGVEPGKELTRYLGLVGDAATIAGIDMSEMGSIFNKVMTSGKVQGDIFDQLSDHGIPVVQMIAKEMGITADEVYKLGSEGKIGADIFIEAMASMEGAALKGGETTTGAFKNMNAALGRFGAKVLEDIFPLIGPALGQVTSWLDRATNAVGPFMDEVVGGFRAFGAAWAANDGDITSSGFPGFMEQVAYWLHQGYDAMNRWYPVWAPFAAGVAAMTGTFVAYKVALQAVATAQGIMTAVTTAWQVITGIQTGTLWGLTTAQWAALAPIALTVGALIALAVGIKMAYERVGWFRDLVDTAWAWIKSVISGVVDWFTGTAVPAFQGALAAIGEWFTGLYRDYVAPVWEWVKQSVSDVVGWFTDSAAPAMGGALGAVGGWFTRMNSEYVQPAMQSVKDIFGGVVSWIGEAVGWLGEKFSWLYNSVIHPVWYGVMATITMVAAILLTIFQGIAWVVTTLLGPVFTWLYESVIKPVWGFIQGAITGFMVWWKDTAVPFIQAAIGVLALAWEIYKDQLVAVWNFVTTAIQVFLDWWDGVAVPFIQAAIAVATLAWQAFSAAVGLVWDWISSKISAAWAWVQASVLIPAKAFLENVLVPAFIFLWIQVSNVWDWISSKISFTWNFVRDSIFTPLVIFLDATVGAAFRALWRTVEHVWNWISDKISGTWNWLRDSVLAPLGNYITTTFVGFFDAMKDGVGRAWNAFKDVVREPVRFVIDTVINGGVIKNYNKLNDFWGGDDLAEMKFPAGFRKGGFTGNYGLDEVAGVVHGREFVTRAEATEKVNREHPGFLETLNRTGSVMSALGAAAGSAHGSHCAHCAGAAAMGAAVSHSTTAGTAGAPPSGSSGIWGAFQAQIARAGRLFVPKMNFMGVNTENVARAWIGRSAVEIIPGTGPGPSVSFASGGAGTWGFNAGSQIWMQPGVPQNMREAVLIHELGHALSLHHTMNTGSIMHPLMQGPTWPSALDYGSLMRAWGAPGEGVKTYDGGGGGIFSMLANKAEEMITGAVRSLADGARKKFLPNRFVDMPIGVAEKTAIDVVKKAASFFGGADGAAGGLKPPALYDNGGLITRGVQLIDHQRSTPDYVLTDKQWAAMYEIAQSTASAQQGQAAIQIGSVHGYTAEEVAAQIEKERLQQMALAL